MALSVEPLKRWREEVGRQVLKLDFVALADAPFGASIAPILTGDAVRIVRMKLSPGFTKRDNELSRDGEDLCVIAIARTGGIEVDQMRRRARLAAGDATLLRTIEPGDFGAALTHAYMAVLIPAPLVASRVKNVEDLTATRVTRENDALALLRAYLRTLELTPITGEEVRAAAGQHVINLAVLTLASERSRLEAGPAASVHEARFQVALELIARHFREPGLSILAVAAHQNISVRYLQMLFERKGLRFTEHVNALRLAEAYRLLTTPDARDRSIIGIAHAAGFSDLSHFNRLFRRRYDATPGSVRSEAGRVHERE